MQGIAKEDMGKCPDCGSGIEAGEWFRKRGTETFHAGCVSWRTESAIEAEPIPASGYLFSQPELAMIEHAKDVLNVKHIDFDGETSMQVDQQRLSLQAVRVFELMRDGQYRTLRQIAELTDCLETSASARLRDFRKARFGSHGVVSRKVEGVTPLLYEYSLIVNKRKLSDEDWDDERKNAA